ncbi:MAG: dihydrolipoyl dehydrogenase [Bacteroidetes bacterium]|nr:dihydrolipoyl dehydrogenase [Bacteroidota bacterium]
MVDRQYDVAVIGGGPGGYVAAIRAAQLGFYVALVEREKLGGVCLNWGCIPSKALLKSAELYNAFKNSGEFGITHSGLQYDFSKIIKRSRNVAERLSKGVEYLMKKNKIDVIKGAGKLINRNIIEVENGEELLAVSSKAIILATGGSPKSIPGVTIDRKKIITSAEAMTLLEQPESMIIIGGGAIGVEFAYFYNSFGTKVTIVEMMPAILPNEDREHSKIVENSLKKSGINIFTSAKVESVQTGENVVLKVVTADGEKELTASVALMAVGVQANKENIGLESVGIEVEKGFIKTSEFMETNVKGIYAIGDVTGAPMLAHAASHEGIIAADHIAGKAEQGVQKFNIPHCTYCQPQVASIGLTEEEAVAKGFEIKVGRFPFRSLGKAVAIGETEGQVKLIFDEKNAELLGAHIVGADATELIAELGIARTLKSSWMEIHNTIHAHPTLSEAIMEAAGQAFGASINI